MRDRSRSPGGLRAWGGNARKASPSRSRSRPKTRRSPTPRRARRSLSRPRRSPSPRRKSPRRASPRREGRSPPGRRGRSPPRKSPPRSPRRGRSPPRKRRRSGSPARGAKRCVYFQRNEAGGLVGRNGENIKDLTDRAGCDLQVSKGADSEGWCSITIDARDDEQFEDVVKILVDCPKLSYLKDENGKVLKTGTNYNGGIQQSTRGKRSGEVADEIWVPDRYVGLCIGAQGKDILRIEADTRTKITVHKFCPPGKKERCIEIHGPQQGVEEAKSRLTRAVADAQAKPVKFVKDDYDYQDKGVLDKIRKVIDYQDL